MTNRRRKSWRFSPGLWNHCRWWLQPWNQVTASWQESFDKPRECIKKQRYHFANKSPYIQGYGLSSSHVQMWELENKKGWVPNNWCLWTAVLEKTFESPLATRRSNQSILQEIRAEYSLEGLMLKLKLQYFGHLMQTHWKTPWCWERLKAGGEGDDRGWDGRMASPTRWTWVWVSSEVGDGQGSLACCSPWGHKESDTTEQLNWTELMFTDAFKLWCWRRLLRVTSLENKEIKPVSLKGN